MAFTIYMAEDPRGRRYIGCTKKTAERRWKDNGNGWASSAEQPLHLMAAIHRYGRDAFRLTVLATVAGEADAAAIETLMIAKYGTMTPVGYNFMRSSHYRSARYARAA